MAIGTQNDFSMRSGDSRTLMVTINNDTGSPLDLTGATFIWALSKKAADTVAPKGAALLNKTIVSGYAAWQPNTFYSVDDEVSTGGNVYINRSFGGNSGTTAPTGTGNGIVDGQAIWDWQSVDLGGSGSGITVIDVAAGRIDIVLDATDTDALSGEYYHELQLTSAISEISTVLYGQVTIAKDLI